VGRPVVVGRSVVVTELVVVVAKSVVDCGAVVDSCRRLKRDIVTIYLTTVFSRPYSTPLIYTLKIFCNYCKYRNRMICTNYSVASWCLITWKRKKDL
jgi:hypothetical protein